MSHAYILFHSTHHALWAEKVLQGEGLVVKVTSVPRELSSDCGYCVRIAAADHAAAAAALTAAGVEFDRVANA